MLGVSMQTQSEARIPQYMTPFSFPLQAISILTGTSGSPSDVPLMKNMESKHEMNKPAPTVRNDVPAPKTHVHFGCAYPEFYAGPHAQSMSEVSATGQGFARSKTPINTPHPLFKMTHGHMKHMDAHHRGEEVKSVKSQARHGESHVVTSKKSFHKHRHDSEPKLDMASKEHEKEGVFMKKAMEEHKKEGRYM